AGFSRQARARADGAGLRAACPETWGGTNISQMRRLIARRKPGATVWHVRLSKALRTQEVFELPPATTIARGSKFQNPEPRQSLNVGQSLRRRYQGRPGDILADGALARRSGPHGARSPISSQYWKGLLGWKARCRMSPATVRWPILPAAWTGPRPLWAGSTNG